MYVTHVINYLWMIGWKTMIEQYSIEMILSYAVLGVGALIIFGVLSLFKDSIEKKQKKISRKVKKKILKK